MGLFGKKDRQQGTGDDVYSGYSRELAELLRLNAAGDDEAIDGFMERNLVRPGFAQAVLDAGIDYWAVEDFGPAMDLLQSLDLALIASDFPDSMRAETKHYIARCFALTGRENLAIDLWREAVELGSIEANFLLYQYLPEGTGLAELKAAAAGGHTQAIETLAQLGESASTPMSLGGLKAGGAGASGLSMGAGKLGVGAPGAAAPITPSESGPAANGFCGQCGTARAVGAVFCGSCGGRFPA
jgi:hypothetical protein